MSGEISGVKEKGTRGRWRCRLDLRVQRRSAPIDPLTSLSYLPISGQGKAGLGWAGPTICAAYCSVPSFVKVTPLPSVYIRIINCSWEFLKTHPRTTKYTPYRN